MKRVRAANPGSTRLAVFSLDGASKGIRHARATMVARLVAQSRMLILSEPQGEKNHTALAIVMGDEAGHEAIAVRLASAWNEAAGPDLSRDMPSPVWIGTCRKCGAVVWDQSDDRGHGPHSVALQIAQAVGGMLMTGLAVDRVPGPVAVEGCRCEPQRTEPRESVASYASCNPDAGRGQA